MSVGPTPARARGMPVPGIDTQGAFGSHQSSPHGLPTAWPMTPPQSVIELRRPSLAYSSVSDASTSGPSSICDYSQPATPVHSMHSSDHFAHNSWNQDATMSANMSEQCSLGQPSQSMYNAAPFHAMSGVELTGFSPTRHRLGDTFSSHNQSPMRDAWSHAGQPGLNLGAEIKSELFQTKHDDASSMYANPASSVQNPSLEPSLFQEFNNLTSMFPPAQVVIPSQVNPQEDYHMEQFNDYDTNERVVEEFSRSFDSSTTGYSGWETVGPQSPDAAYYVPSEDEDYLMVKDEFEGSPGSFQYRSPQRVNRRATRKSRKTLGPSHVLAEHDRHGILVSYEGTPWKYDSAGNAIAKHTDGAKPHLRCNWVEKDGSKCSAKFVRSEHLKRHMTKHSKEKPYPCPLNGCEKAIKRPDNAGDHFRTHLKPAAKGKRNKECTLEQLAAAMHADPLWDEKKTTKMLNNLFKWFHEFTQQGEEKKRLQTFDEEAKAQAKRMQQSRHMHFKL